MRGMKWEDAPKLGYPNECLSKQTLDHIFRQDTAKRIPRIEPDLFGEIFVVKVFSGLNAVERSDFLQSAWGINPFGTGLSLFNMRKDFPDDEIVEILDETPRNIDAIPFWAGVRVDLIADSDTSLEDVDIHYKEINELITYHKDNKDINLASSMAIFNALSRFGEAERWDDLQSSLDTLHDTAARFPDDQQIQLALAQGAFNAANTYGKAERWDDRQSSIDTLHDTAARFPEDSQFVQLLELVHKLSDLNRNTGG
jgi:hypothetical protein